MNSTTSSQASSNFGFNPVAGNPNTDVLSHSDFELKHRVLAVLTYTFALKKGWDTTIGTVYEGAAGHPYSVLYNGDANGDGQFSNDLVYVPTGLSDPMGAKFVGGPTGKEWFAYNDYITHNNFLRNFRGSIAPRNGGRDPWINRLDLHFSQRIPVKWVWAEFTADILNFTNMLDSNWGQDKRFSAFGTPQPVTLNSTTACYTYTGVGAKATVQSDRRSRFALESAARHPGIVLRITDRSKQSRGRGESPARFVFPVSFPTPGPRWISSPMPAAAPPRSSSSLVPKLYLGIEPAGAVRDGPSPQG